MYKIVFMGSDPIALPMLNWLHGNAAAHDASLVAVYSQPDRRRGRGKKLQPNAISAWALQYNIPLLRPEKPTRDTSAWFKAEGIDLVLVMAYGHMLRQHLLDVPPLGFLNFHASLLPKYRGASPVETAVANGESETGVSLMRIIQKMDAGAVCDVERTAIDPLDTGGHLRDKLAAACVPLLDRNLSGLLAGSAHFTEQDDSAATYCRKLEKTDGILDFSQPAEVLAARINGLDPWPGCFCEHGDVRLKLRQASAVASLAGRPGEVTLADADGVCIASGEGGLLVRQLQRPGGKMLPAGDFLRGYELSVGSLLRGGKQSVLVAREPFKWKP